MLQNLLNQNRNNFENLTKGVDDCIGQLFYEGFDICTAVVNEDHLFSLHSFEIPELIYVN